MATCPLCDSVLEIEDEELSEGDEFTCEDCGASLTVASTNPLEIESAAEEDEEEDADDDEDPDFDDDEDEDEELEDEEDEKW